MTASDTLPRGRASAPEAPQGQLQLQAPPPLERSEGSTGALLTLIPMLGSVGSIVVVATMSGAGGRQYVSGGMFLFSTLAFLCLQFDRQRTQRRATIGARRTDYLHYLGGVREVVRDAADRQRRALTWHHPAPTTLAALAKERSRLWERGSGDPRFLHVRYGVGPQPLALELVPPESTPGQRGDPAGTAALHRLLVVHRRQPDLPVTLDLQTTRCIEVCGEPEDARAVARALVCSATAFHGPGDLVVAILAAEQAIAEWDWIKWLPHAESTRESDAIGPRRMVAVGLDQLVSLLPTQPGIGGRQPPHLLLVVDRADIPLTEPALAARGCAGVTVLHLPGRWGDVATALRLRLADAECGGDGAASPRDQLLQARQPAAAVAADRVSLASAEAFARRLTPLRALTAPPGNASAEFGTTIDLTELLGLGDVRHLEPDRAWRRRPAHDQLRVPIGLGDDGAPVHLDLKESAQHGMGPHGLVIGATGSGKSEFLRTLVLGLALTHSPERLNMVLIDFKGGATFAGMARMPHVSAVITNLAGDLSLVERMQDALAGEMVRRQELLRAAGNLASVTDYESARASDPSRAGLPPLPSLFVVVDEFSELLSAKPELIDLFVAIGRLGRSLGLHLLLASQRLDEGRLRGLESHLSYRIGLRTFSAQESRAVLGLPDAYELPPVPGLGYLRADPTTLQRFQAAYVSGPHAGPGTPPRQHDGTPQGILPFTVAEVRRSALPDDQPRAPARTDEATGSVLELAVRRMAGHGPAARQVWLPPLDEPDTLGGLMPDLVVDPRLGLVSPGWRRRGALVVPIGTVDCPRQQRRDTLTIDLRGAEGHVAVVGGPRSGKSTLVRTILTSIALTTTPLETQFYVLDFGGGTFTPLTGLPHVAGVGSRTEPDVVRRVVAAVRGIIDRRETYFRGRGIDSIETYRARREEGSADDGFGDVFLVVDGWGALRESFDDLEIELQQLATRALTFGVHIVAAASRWTDFRAAMRDMFGTRLELRLGDPLDSEIDRRLAALVPRERPGRGLVREKLHFLGALPRIDPAPQQISPAAATDDLLARVTAAWTGPAAPKLRLLPGKVTLEEVRAAADPDAIRTAVGPLLLALDERDLTPVSVDPTTEPHLLVFGDGRSGKSSLLRAYAREVMRTRTVTQAQLVVVDFRRSLLGEIPEEYLLNYLTNAAQATPALQELAAYLATRIPGPDVTPGQLRSRSWWSGAEVFVLVDDYDLVVTQQGSPVHALQPLLAQARDIGLHLVVARRSGGASRALFEPVIQSLRDLAAPGLILSGSPEEGPLLGSLRPTAAPPGRGRLVTRDRGVEVVQLAWTDPLL